jgi:DNA gyrase/topoisomerase IV subunit A
MINMITTILITSVILLIIISIILFIRGYSVVKRMETLEDMIIRYDEREGQTKAILEMMLKQMREIDIRGSFESDDEVGAVFTQLKELIETYSKV